MHGLPAPLTLRRDRDLVRLRVPRWLSAIPRFLRRAWEQPAVRLVCFALWFRALFSALAVVANLVFPLAQREQFTVLGRTDAFWDSFARYDSGWYFGIARYGYEYVEGGRNNLAFFPLYPLLMRYVGLSLGGGRHNLYIAGIVISWVAFIAACIILFRLAREYVSVEQAETAVVFAMAFPFAFFYGVVYSESLFLLLSVSAFLAFRKKHWLIGGIAGAALSATRVNGILALPALALVAWQAAGDDRGERRRALAGVGLVPLGLAAYSVYVFTLSGSLLEWMYSITRWNYHPGGAPWIPLVNLLGPLLADPYGYLLSDRQSVYDLLNGAAVIFALGMLPLVQRRLGWAFVLLIIPNLWLPLSSGVLEGTGRYCAVLFPLFIGLGTIRSRFLRQMVLVSFAGMYMLCRALFTTLHPIF